MRTRASTVLFSIALAQFVVLGASLAFLSFSIRSVRTELVRLGREEQAFLTQLADAESDIYRVSSLMRDEIVLDGPEQVRAKKELVALLERFAGNRLEGPAWISDEMRTRLHTVDAARREYLSRARDVANWNEMERRTFGLQYLARQLAPTREKFMGTAREIAVLVQSLRESRTQAIAASLSDIQSLVSRLLLGSALFGLVLVGWALWRFHRYEMERDGYLRSLQNAEDGLRALSQSLVESQELERKTLSRELHDEVGQILTALRVQLGQIETADPTSKSHLLQACELSERSLKSVREMARGLRPAMLDDLGLAPALQWLGRDISKTTVLDVEVRIEGELSNLDEDWRTCLYRVVQEALTNCVKHAEAKAARVVLHEGPNDIVLTIQDNGKGFEPGTSTGIGLLGMRERVEELGGEFTVISSVDAGTLIRVNLNKTKAGPN
jgi:signal transduction histidine kinase